MSYKDTKVSSYYNLERKLKFINDYASGIVGEKRSGSVQNRETRYKIFFSKTSKYENEFGKDICEFDDKETLYFIKRYIGNITNKSKYSRIGIYRAYLDWCLKNDYINMITYTNNYVIKFKKTSRWEDFDLVNISSEECVGHTESDEYIFGSENDFINYIKKIFSDDKFAMESAAIILLYYGFSKADIANLTKDVVNKDQNSVNGVVINNNDAFNIILRARNIEKYEVEGNDQKIYTVWYSDSKFVIRKRKKGFGISRSNTNSPVPISFFSRIRKYEDDACELLPNDSIYKNIRVSAKTISKLKFFYTVLEYENKYGTEYVKNMYKCNWHNLFKKEQMVSYKDYTYMKVKIEKI